MYEYIGNGESYARIPARNLTDAEFAQYTTGLTAAERRILDRLYRKLARAKRSYQRRVQPPTDPQAS